MTAADILKPELENSRIQLICAMTDTEYADLEQSDPVLAQRFQTIRIEEPSLVETIRIAQALKPNYEAHHQVKISDEAIDAAVRLSVRYLPTRVLPRKAISTIDEAASRVHLHRAQDETPQVTKQDIVEVIALWTNIPVTDIDNDIQ